MIDDKWVTLGNRVWIILIRYKSRNNIILWGGLLGTNEVG